MNLCNSEKTNTSHLNNLLQNIFVYNSLIVTGKGEPQQYNTFSRRKHMAATIGSKIYFRIFFISFMVAAKAASCLYNTFSHIKHMATTRRSHPYSHIFPCGCNYRMYLQPIVTLWHGSLDLHLNHMVSS